MREKHLEGPGAEARLARLNARFRAISRRLPPHASPRPHAPVAHHVADGVGDLRRGGALCGAGAAVLR